MVQSRTVINAIIGAVISVVLSFIPLSPVIGGVVAGFLEGPDEHEGTKVGALAGSIAFLPIALGGFLILGLLGFSLGFVGGVPAWGIAFVLILIVSTLLFLLLYTVGLSALGGYLGASLADDYPAKRRRTRETIGFDTPPDRSGHTADVAPVRGREPEPDREPDRDREHDQEQAQNRDSDRDRNR